jgi:hypothetical protein
VTNLGGKWPATLALAAVDAAALRRPWSPLGDVDGFYTLTAAGTAAGAAWLWAMRHQVSPPPSRPANRLSSCGPSSLIRRPGPSPGRRIREASAPCAPCGGRARR